MNRDNDLGAVLGALILLAYLVSLGVYLGRRYDGFMLQQAATQHRLFALEHPELSDIGKDGNNG